MEILANAFYLVILLTKIEVLLCASLLAASLKRKKYIIFEKRVFTVFDVFNMYRYVMKQLYYYNNLSNTLCDATKKVSRRRTDFVANFPYIVLRVPLRQEIKKPQNFCCRAYFC